MNPNRKDCEVCMGVPWVFCHRCNPDIFEDTGRIIEDVTERPVDGIEDVVGKYCKEVSAYGGKIKVRSLYHKPIGERGIGKWIVGYTWLLGLFYNWGVLKHNYSHEELWFCSFDADHPSGFCFSSTTRGDAEGVRFDYAADVLKHPERWDYAEFKVPAGRLEVALDEAMDLVGRKYDFAGILGFINPFPVQDGNRWYCSEICNWFKGICGIAKISKRISPRRSAYLMEKAGYKIRPLV